MSKEEVLEKLNDVQQEWEETITAIAVKKAEEVYGDTAIEPKRELIVMHIDKSNIDLTISMPRGLKYDKKKAKYIITDKRTCIRSLSNANSMFGKFLRKYNAPPKSKMKIKVRLDKNGFVRLAL
jgi:adenine-specific DNA methylase